MRRRRRDILRLGGISLTTLVAGCLDDSGTSPETPTEQPTETPTEQPTETPTEQPTDPGSQLPADLERVDAPPYEVRVPECSFDSSGSDGGRDPLYLCANMAAEPSLSFTQSETRGRTLADEGLSLTDDYGDQAYATLLTEGADRVRDEATGETAQLIRETDFDSHAVLVIQTGWGSGSVYPHIKRVESTATGVHAVGCHSDPCIQTDDITARTAAVRFERPETIETGVVSLTVAPDERWNVAAGEGVVDIPSEN